MGGNKPTRLKILFQLPTPVLVPWDYQTDLTRLIYKTLALSDSKYAKWLHDEGFRRGPKVYRLFVHSNLQPSRCQPSKDGLWMSGNVVWQIASPDFRFIENFMKGLKKRGKRIKLFQKPFNVVDMVRLELDSFVQGTVFRTLSPIVSSVHPKIKGKPATYLSPDRVEFVQTLEKNLIAKWEAFYQRDWKGGEIKLRVWNPRSKLIKIFGINVRGWHLMVQMWGSEELIRFAYYAGLGERNSQGFGMLEVG